MSDAHKSAPSAGTSQCDRMPIAVRAFATPAPEPELGPKKSKAKHFGKSAPPSQWTLVFDTETTVDATQRLRVGAYQIRNGDTLDQAGLFYDPAALTVSELELLRRIAGEKGCELRTAEEFVDDILFDRAYDHRASIVGFNLPFDISRLTFQKAGSAQGKTMRGGFSLRPSRRRWRPTIQIRHLSARAALIQFAYPRKNRWTPKQRKRGVPSRQRRGAFIDLKTIGAALFSRSFSLASLADFIKTPTRKGESGGHGLELTPEYVGYLRQDVQVTWECFLALRDRYELHALEETPLGKVLSEASIGKAYLKQMRVKPFAEVQPDFPKHLTGKILSAYYGGRAEVRWRRTIRQVFYCDFLSMYPTVCTLMGLWRFVIAQGVTWSDSTIRIRALVESVSLGDLQHPEFWSNLTTLVRVQSVEDIFPVRAKYDGKSQTIGLNQLTSKRPLWFTLADVIASKLLTGRAPEILETITYSPEEPQPGLKEISIAGNSNYRIDPTNDDFFKRSIDLRSEVKVKRDSAIGEMRDELDGEQQGLKQLANSTSYGIFVEMNVAELNKAEKLNCFGPNGECFSVVSKKVEEPGRYFHPLLATMITGAARLMLAIAEKLAENAGLDWAFCDTDSIALAKPDGMDETEFYARSQSVREWFSRLNPYAKKGPLLQIEDENHSISAEAGKSKFEPLYCFCISAKRYVLFNLSERGEVVIRKASAHGLGHFLAPYGANDAPKSVPAPSVDLSVIGVERWQYDLWHKIIRAALDGHSDQVTWSYHKGLKQPAASRYGATTPALLRWFKAFNLDRKYPDQVKPFNFLISFQARPQFELPDVEQFAFGKRGRPRKRKPLRPVAAFNRDIGEAAKSAFDRETGKPVAVDLLMTYAEALAQYHLRPEAKFLNGNYRDQGRTERRHVVATEIGHIGKEANKWEEQYFLGGDGEAEIEYGVDDEADARDAKIRALREEIGERDAAKRLGISRTALRRALKLGITNSMKSVRSRICGAMDVN